MKGYKAFDKGFTCKGFQYDIGKEYTLEGELKICKSGFHFCKNLIDVFGYYPFNRDNVVFAEVEAFGDIQHEGTKYCTDKIKILREVPWTEVDDAIKDEYGNSGYWNSGNYNSGNYNSGNYNSGKYNSRDCNSGDYNSGYYNSGNHNSGNHNSGDYNSGDYNSGKYNSGSYNSRDCNSGDCNSGDYNSGYYNSGNYNSGNHNSGYCNSGNYNSGNHNSGYCNSGNYNSGDYNSGFFNSNTPTVRLFNKDSGMTFDEIWALGIDWSNLENSKAIIQGLPNYDAQIFFDATGIDWR